MGGFIVLAAAPVLNSREGWLTLNGFVAKTTIGVAKSYCRSPWARAQGLTAGPPIPFLTYINAGMFALRSSSGDMQPRWP